ncbi:MAG TPA: hypothetical protein VI248_01455, partial [Kineosporiaceae bacterium]
MCCLVAVVPEGEVRRADVVPVRLARKVAPLFGVPWSGNPFGRTWVCDFAALTLAEIGRGAPYPARADEPDVDGHAPEGSSPSWAWAGRGVWTPNRAPTPAALPAATMNRFGPDTKAAVVLTAANRLLRDATQAVVDVSGYLASRDVDPTLRLATWAGLVLEVYRAQPALMVAALQARAVQRSLTARWGAQLVTEGSALPPGARSELPQREDGDQSGTDSPWQPVQLDVVDATLPALQLGRVGAAGGNERLNEDRLDDLAEAWCRRLLRLGRPGRGLVWLTEAEGHRQARAYVRAGAVVAPFVAEMMDGAGRLRQPPLPDLPTVQDVESLPVPSRRAFVVAAHAAVNYLRYRDDLLQCFPALREHTRRHVECVTGLASGTLGPADPATLLITGYRDYLDLWDRVMQPPPEDDGELDASAARLRSFLERILALPDGGTLDPGMVTYLLELGNTALAAAIPITDERTTVPRFLARSWRACLAARGLTERQVLDHPDQVHPSQAFHLQHYAAHVAHRGGPRQLRQALAVQSRVADVRDAVARDEPAGYAAKHTASRTAHEIAAGIATFLVEALPPLQGQARSAARAEALRHAVAVLANPSTAELVRTGQPAAAV